MNETPKASYWFKTDEELTNALELAEENATTAWEMQFVSDQTKKAEKWGLEMYLTENQYEHLQKIMER